MEKILRTYTELSKFQTFTDRYNYLKLDGIPTQVTFGGHRYLNQQFYKSPEWKRIRDKVNVRDNGCDLRLEGYDISGQILIHHMNPLTIYDFENFTDYLLNPEFLISVSLNTHNAIHYGDESQINNQPITRAANDTCPWKI